MGRQFKDPMIINFLVLIFGKNDFSKYVKKLYSFVKNTRIIRGSKNKIKSTSFVIGIALLCSWAHGSIHPELGPGGLGPRWALNPKDHMLLPIESQEV